MTESTTKKISFSYDPFNLMKIWMQRFVELFVQNKYYKAKQYACYDLLNDLTEEQLHEYIEEYRKRHNVEFVTLEDWEAETRLIWDVIYESDNFKNRELEYKKKGHGVTGLGVIYVPDGSYYDCEFAGHWAKVKQILLDRKPEYSEALEILEHKTRLNEYNGVTREELDVFILKNFEMVGASRKIENYLG